MPDERKMVGPPTMGLLVIVAVGLATWVGAVHAKTAAPVFGEAVNGLKIGLAILPMTWEPGEEITFVCAMRNVTEKPIRVAAWGLDLAQVLEVTDAAGNILKVDGRRDHRRPMPADAFQTIQPGAVKTFTLAGRLMKNKMLLANELLGSVRTWRLADGEYTVRAVYYPAADNEKRRRPQSSSRRSSGKVLSAPVKVTIGAKAPKAPKAREPVNGLKLTLTADKTELKMTRRNLRRALRDTPPYNTEPTKLTFTFTNVSDKPIKVDAYEFLWRRLALVVKGPDAESVRVLDVKIKRRYNPRVPADYPVLAPGASWTCKWRPTFPGQIDYREYILLKPGEYRIKAIYAAGQTPRRKVHVLERGAWVGSVTSNEIVLKAAPDKGK